MAATALTRALGPVIAVGAAAGMALTIGAGAASAHDWTGVAECESGGDWHIDTGNGFYGGLQFSMDTWHAYGGTGNPAHATPAEQVRVAERVLDGQGIGAWPSCGERLRDGTSPALATEGVLPDGALGSLAPGSLESLDPLGSSASAIPPGPAGPLGSLGAAG